MILHYLLLLPHVWATAAADVATTHTEQTCQGTCDGDVARGKTLLSLKADMAVKSVVAADTESIFKDVVESFQENATAMNATNASWDRVNQSLQNLVTNVMVADINQTQTVPNPEGNYTDPENRTGLGKLSQTLEFLYLKVAQLETAVELQSIEFRTSKSELDTALVEIQMLKDRLDHKEVVVQQLSAKLKHHQTQSAHGHAELQEPEPAASNKHQKTWKEAQPQKQQKHQRLMGEKAQEVLRDVLLKHHRQSETKDWNPAPKQTKTENVKHPSKDSLLQRQRRRHRSQELDSTVSAKGVPIVDDVVDAVDSGANAVVDTANTVAGEITNGAGLVGDALTNAYQQAADKVSFVANTVIDTVEQAMAILVGGFSFSAGCPDWVWPSLAVSDDSISIGWGRQRCEVVLVGQRLTLFDFNWGTTTVPYPAPIAAMVALGSNLVNCITGGGAPFDVFKCVAISIGETLLQVVPPFSILTQLSSMLSEFIAYFVELASAAITGTISETTSLVEEAVKIQRFPARGAGPKLVSSRGKGLSAHIRRNEHRRKVRKSASMLQTKEEPDDTMGSGAIGIATTEAMPYASMLITQFGGDEYDTASCLGFAPAHRTGPGNTVTQRDWQVPSPDSTDFVKLEPWGVPCDNQWAKDNPGKWEGYSFYTYESVIEKCVAVSYTMSAQPVLAFVGGLEFDLMPAPLAEITTEVCWPDRVTAPDLSLIVTTIRTAGLVLFKHTIRLHKRFGSNTAFETGNFKDAVERGRNYFGKGTSADDDKGLQGMSRTAMSQLDNKSNARKDKEKTESRESPAELSVHDFYSESEELYLASARYTNKGVKILESFHGHEATQRARAALGKENITVLQEDSQDREEEVENGTKQLGQHQLFELGSPSGALVGFSVKGLLTNGVTQLQVNMKFGPLDSPTKTVDLLNLVDHLRVVLAAIPFVSQASKQKAIDSMTSTDVGTQVPTTDTVGPLSFLNHWVDYGEGYRDSIYRYKDGICSIQALVKNGVFGDFATLPSECRPDQRLIFSMNTEQGQGRVDVQPDGRVSWVSAGGGSWATLSNVIFVPGATGWPVTLRNNWVIYPSAGYGTPTYKVKGALCIVDGLISGGNWGELGELPEECRPVARQIFTLNNHQDDLRVDVEASGKISYQDGHGSHNTNHWISLTGIIFVTDANVQQILPLASGWSAWGAPFGGPKYAVAEGLCILDGLTSGTQWGHTIATLPVECWPMRVLSFGTFGSSIQRIDITPEGNVNHIGAGSTHGWITLAGIAFAQETSGVRLLPLRSGWGNYPGFGEATFNMKNGLCTVEGLVQNGAWSTFAVLPVGCRPTKRLIFVANHHDHMHRVDILTDGSILWTAGSKTYDWLSLSNIAFAPETVGHIALPLVNGWSAYAGVFGNPDYTVRNGLCSLEGLLYKAHATMGDVATLPSDCRPSGQLIFLTSNNESPRRVDVSTDGRVSYIVGGTQDWLSVSGIVFSPVGSGAVSYPIPLENGWANYGHPFAGARYFLTDGMCSLQGLVRGGAMTSVGTLPLECRPGKILVYSMNHHEYQWRIDVRTDGTLAISAATGTQAYDWVSLSGIVFEPV